ncbi:hypothetical protein BOX15_Mlig017698g2 [Macrostomum lignano]|uniref:Uncharacterized protein n=2 Tax=Macrostomum lignano TaxID=282301 RepID=A0A267GMD2_9PLAT|nr:hypothetical protein BOX15_Mlig017698g1 [Macrostomum lignano]PAA85940.1 hypothetical protein BOX15_Mlig017698g3 [Macrostomum lignano]PAA86584.1 hypothetical protein BOX15_Mlig017698g2 [Macrostomum lignano]
MSFSQKDNYELQMKARKELTQEQDPVKRLRLSCMSRGAAGIKGFSRQFRIMDDDGNKRLSMAEFRKGVADFGLDLTDEEVKAAFNQVDTDQSGSIDFSEFLAVLRPPLNESRLKLIKAAFQKMDKTGDGQITVKDLKGIYNARQHPKYQNGEWSEDQVFTEFLKTFEAPNTTDGVVTWEEFLNYYSGISNSIDHDSYFDLMMRNSWKL